MPMMTCTCHDPVGCISRHILDIHVIIFCTFSVTDSSTDESVDELCLDIVKGEILK